MLALSGKQFSHFSGGKYTNVCYVVSDVFLQGLMQCAKLEELTLDDNLIHNTEGIGKLGSLKWLSLSSNQLSELSDDLWTLSKLHYLNISHNSISTLHHLKVMPMQTV